MNKSVSHRGLLPSALRGIIYAFVSALAVAAICAFVALCMPEPSEYAVVFAPASLFFSAFFGGFGAGRAHGGRALICGALTAAVMLALVSLFALIFAVKMNISVFMLRALGVLVCSVLGANIGAGSRAARKKKKIAHKRG